MHDKLKPHEPEMIGALGKVLEPGNACAWIFKAWLAGKLTCGCSKPVNDIMSRILVGGGFHESRDGDGCLDHGGKGCARAFADIPCIRDTGSITRTRSVRDAREQHPPFGLAPRPATLFRQCPDAGHPR